MVSYGTDGIGGWRSNCIRPARNQGIISGRTELCILSFCQDKQVSILGKHQFHGLQVSKFKTIHVMTIMVQVVAPHRRPRPYDPWAVSGRRIWWWARTQPACWLGRGLRDGIGKAGVAKFFADEHGPHGLTKGRHHMSGRYLKGRSHCLVADVSDPHSANKLGAGSASLLV